MWLVRNKRGGKSIGPSFAQPLKEMHVNERTNFTAVSGILVLNENLSPRIKIQ